MDFLTDLDFSDLRVKWQIAKTDKQFSKICIEHNAETKETFIYFAWELPLVQKPVIARLFDVNDFNSPHDMTLAISLWLFASPVTVMTFLADKTPSSTTHKSHVVESWYLCDKGELGLLSKAQVCVRIWKEGIIDVAFFGGACFYSFGISSNGTFVMWGFNSTLKEG